jgi:hypothetical protein
VLTAPKIICYTYIHLYFKILNQNYEDKKKRLDEFSNNK